MTNNTLYLVFNNSSNSFLNIFLKRIFFRSSNLVIFEDCNPYNYILNNFIYYIICRLLDLFILRLSFIAL